jgi:hypothetical protein
MLTDIEIKLHGVKPLMAFLGKVDAERLKQAAEPKPLVRDIWKKKCSMKRNKLL